MLCLSRLFHVCLLFTQDVNCDSFIALITLPVSFAQLQEVIAASLPLQLPSLVPGTSLLASLLCLSPAACADHSCFHPSPSCFSSGAGGSGYKLVIRWGGSPVCVAAPSRDLQSQQHAMLGNCPLFLSIILNAVSLSVALVWGLGGWARSGSGLGGLAVSAWGLSSRARSASCTVLGVSSGRAPATGSEAAMCSGPAQKCC